ncbi:MAG: hypothetical protein K2N42_00640, partial [Anaeroplasmataceae bacterium]|nr:hypothetical protein [Anaeroplasmataceae bacterium]
NRHPISQEEIRLLASKYGFDIPLRFKKDDLLTYVKAMMKSRKKLTLALQRELNEMTITQLNEYCTLQGLGISSQMKKEEMINLLTFLVKNAKFSAIEAKKIYGLPMSEPLKFRVELSAIDSFKRGLPKKVIYLEEDEIEEFQKLDEFIEEEKPQIKKTNSHEEVVTGVIKKLFPYLNVDEDTAKVASQHGINVTPVEEPKKAPKTPKTPKEPKTKTITITQEKRIVAPSNNQTVKKEQVKGKVDQALLDEILKKFHGIKENEPVAPKPEDKRNDQALLDEILDKLQKITEAQEKIKEELQTTKQEKKIVTERKVRVTRKYDDDGLPYDFIDEDDVDDDEFNDYNFEPEEDPEEILKEIHDDSQNQSPAPEDLIARLREETQVQVSEPVEESVDESQSTEENLQPNKNPEEALDEVSAIENDSMVETEQPEDVILSESEESSEEPLLNESYDKEFEPIEDASPIDETSQEETPATPYMLSTYVEELPSKLENEEAAIEPELENNPYFGKKKILSNKKPLIITLLSIVLCIGIFISIFAIMHALK